MDQEKVICYCRNVKIKDIVAAINNKANTLDEVIEVTQASKGCGGCRKNIEKVYHELTK